MGCTISRKCRHPNPILDRYVTNRQRSQKGIERHRCKVLIEVKQMCVLCRKDAMICLGFIVSKFIACGPGGQN